MHPGLSFARCTTHSVYPAWCFCRCTAHCLHPASFSTRCTTHTVYPAMSFSQVLNSFRVFFAGAQRVVRWARGSSDALRQPWPRRIPRNRRNHQLGWRAKRWETHFDSSHLKLPESVSGVLVLELIFILPRNSKGSFFHDFMFVWDRIGQTDGRTDYPMQGHTLLCTFSQTNKSLL